MCRIAGIINPSVPVEETESLVKEMCNVLKHGGPDDEGYYTDKENHLVFGHRRLALIDLSPGGHQPMSYAEGRYWITYNGELYNYPEIKSELVAAGYAFRSASDTEVILASFAAWGTNAFRRFNGMFAFALWDSEEKIVYLVRDASGIKPLYYGYTANGLAFASELRALEKIPWLSESHPHWPVYLLAYGHIPEPVTTLKEVKPLPKGSFLRYDMRKQKWDIEVFAFYNYLEYIGDRSFAIEQIRERLQQSVQRHLISDAPIGVFLSGGIDSSVMAILAAKFQVAELKTLSIVFEEKDYSEKKYQDLLLDKLHCPNWQEVLTEHAFQQQLPTIIRHMDMPGCDGINTWFISKCARESGLKAVLSGLGGDELFGGYPSFARIDRVNWLKKIPRALLRSGRYSGSKKLKRMAYLSLKGSKGYYLFLRGQFTPSTIAAQLDMDQREVWQVLEEQPELHDVRRLSPGNQASWIEMNMYMQNQLLRDSDVMSMAHGIEIRVPFLDREFVRLALQIKSAVKYSGDRPKQLLVDSFINELPEPIWNRPKMGFSFPFSEWLQKNEYVNDIMQAAGEQGNQNLLKFRNGQLHWSQFMSLLLLHAKRNSYAA